MHTSGSIELQNVERTNNRDKRGGQDGYIRLQTEETVRDQARAAGGAQLSKLDSRMQENYHSACGECRRPLGWAVQQRSQRVSFSYCFN